MENLFFDTIFEKNCSIFGCENCPLKNYFKNMTSDLDSFNCKQYAKEHPQDLITYLELKAAALQNSSNSDAIGSEENISDVILEEGQSIKDAISPKDSQPEEIEEEIPPVSAE